MVRQRLSLASAFVIDVLALYGLVLLLMKYFPLLPQGISFDMVAVAVLVFAFIKTILFDK